MRNGAGCKTVPYAVETDMDATNPDLGEGYLHSNVQLFDVLEEQNRFRTGYTSINSDRDGPVYRETGSADDITTHLMVW